MLALARFNQSLWSDEASSVWFARLPVSTLITSICDPHPPAYYLLLKGWLSIGETEAWLRVPSLLAGLLAVALTYQLGKDRCRKSCAGLAAILLALQPLHSWYASEVRMYALVECLGLLIVWLGWRLITNLQNGAISWPDALAYVFVAALALWIDYTAFLPLGLIQLIWIMRGLPGVRRWIALHLVVVLPIGALWLTSNGLIGLSRSYYPVFLAIQAAGLGLNLTPAIAAVLLQLAVAAAVLIALGLTLHWRRRTFLGSTPAQLVVIGLWRALLVAAVVPRAVTIKRTLVVMLPYLALATAYLLIQWRRVARSVVVVSIIAAAVSLVTLQREPWRAAVTDLLAAPTGQPAAAWVDELAAPAFDSYWRRAGCPTESLHCMPLFAAQLPELPQLTPAPSGTLWIVTTDTPYRRLIVFLPAAFHAEYQLLSEQHATGIAVYRYQRRAQPITTTPPATPLPTDEWGLQLPSPLDTCAR